MGGAPSVAALLEAAVQRHKAGDLGRAEQLYRKVLERDPRQADAAHLLGMLALTADDPATAIVQFDRAVALAPGVADFHASRGVALKALGRLDEAVAAYDTAIPLAPNGADAHYNRGLALSELGRLTDALAAFDKALGLDPRSIAALNNRALVLQDMGLPGEALKWLDKALAIDPQAAEVHNNRGLAYQDLGDLACAVSAFDRALRARPEFAQAHANRGDVFSAMGKPEAGLGSFDQALRIAPHFADAYCGKGVALLKRRDAAGALAALRRCLEISPGHVRALAFLAIALRETGRTEEARTLADPARFPARRALCPPARHGDLNEFLDALGDHVLAHPTLAWEPHGKTTRDGSQTARLFGEGEGVFADFVVALRSQVDAFLADLSVSPDHPQFFQIPRTYRMSIWATVLAGGGHQLPHIHPGGWLSGVYYVALPPTVGDNGDMAGWFEAGRPPPDLPLAAEAEPVAIKPEPGLLLLFPSHVFHQTFPVRGPGPRISIAFDVEPLSFGGPRVTGASTI